MLSLPIPDVAQGHRGGEFGSVLSAMDVLTDPERLVGWDGGNRLAPREMRGGNDEIIDGQARYLIWLVAILLDRGGIRVLNLRIDAKDEHGLIHGGERRGKRPLARVSSLFLLAQKQHVDRKRDGGRETQAVHRPADRLQLGGLGRHDQNSEATVACDEGNRDGRLVGNPIRVMRVLAQILDEGRLFPRPGDADRARLHRRR